MRAANALFLWAAAGLALVNCFSEAVARGMYALFPAISPEGAALLLNAAYYLLFMLLPVLLCSRRTPEIAPRMRLNPISFKGTLAVAFTALVGVLLVTELSLAWALLLEALGLDLSGAETLIPSDTRGLTLFMLASAVLPGICEELLFRGVMLPAWERRGARRAVICTAILFAALHGSLAGLPAELLLGGVIAFIVIAFDSIYAGMIYHTAHNAVVLLANFALTRYSDLLGDSVVTTETASALSGWTIVTLVLEFGYQAAVFAALLLLIRRRMLRHGLEAARETGERMTAAELALLACGAAFAGILYFADFAQMLGLGG